MMGWASLADKGPAALLLTILGIVIGLVVYGVRKMATGQLVPRSTLVDAQKAFDDRLQREKEISDLQRVENANIVSALKKQTEQMETLIHEQALVRDVMVSLRRAGEISAQQRSTTEGQVM